MAGRSGLGPQGAALVKRAREELRRMPPARCRRHGEYKGFGGCPDCAAELGISKRKAKR